MASDRRSGEQARLLNERISTIYLRLLGTAAVGILNASLITTAVDRGSRGRWSRFWLAAVILLSVARILGYRAWRRDPLKLDHVRRWAAWSVAGALGSGLLWGIGPLVSAGPDPASQWLWAFAIGGMCAGAASLHSAHPPTALSFIVPACLPLSLTLLAQGSFASGAAAVMSLAFIGMMTLTALVFSAEFGRTFALKFALERRAAELHDANDRLSQEIEDHRATSEALHQAQKMEALGSLTGGFAHDFNNLLAVIIGNLDVIARRMGAGRPRALVESAIDAAESGANLTSRLLAFARKQTLAPKLVDINRVVADFEELLKRAVSGLTRVTFALSADNPPHSPLIASVDVAQLQAALLNLVVNARDAMPEGGLITVSTAKVRLDAGALVGTEASPGEFVTVAVADQGEGLAPELAARVFEPFFTTRAASGGSGLGLSQVHGFAHQSGGFARFESEPGAGTTVTLFVPASDQPLPAAEAVPPRQFRAPRAPLSVLLVDDNPAVLATLSTALAEKGWEVATATDGAAALALVGEGLEPDIVVSDVDMPGALDGIALEATLRERRPELPFLLISGAPIPGDRIGPDTAYLIKPFRNHVFLREIEALVYP
jgi:signal transduction histidine kinase